MKTFFFLLLGFQIGFLTLQFPLDPFPKKEAKESITKLAAILPEKRKVFIPVTKQPKRKRF